MAGYTYTTVGDQSICRLTFPHQSGSDRSVTGSDADRTGTHDWPELMRLAMQFARVRCTSVEDARDIAQDALLALVADPSAVRDPVSWLFVVTRRLAAKRRAQNRFRPLDGTLLLGLRSQSWADRPTAAALVRWLRTNRRLDTRDRRVLSLVAMGRTHAEIAARIGCSRRDVGQYIRIALRHVERRAKT